MRDSFAFLRNTIGNLNLAKRIKCNRRKTLGEDAEITASAEDLLFGLQTQPRSVGASKKFRLI